VIPDAETVVMGLLEKTNPTATRGSVIRWAIGWAILTPILISLQLRLTPFPLRYWLPVLIMATVLGSGIGALVEWQLDDGEDEEGEKATEGIPPAGIWDRELDQEDSLVTRNR
jgi:hypothetical protein